MERFFIIVVVGGAVLVLSYFAFRPANPVNEARAAEIQLRAQQDAADRELARSQQEALNQIQLQERAARSEQTRAAWATFTKWTGRVLTLGAMVAVLALALSWARFSTGMATAAVQRAEFRATLLYLDKETGQYPALPFVTADGRMLITDTNTGMTRWIDMENPADAQLAAGAIAIRYAGTLARLAAKTQAGNLTGNIVDTPIIFPQQIDLESLQNLLETQQRREEQDDA